MTRLSSVALLLLACAAGCGGARVPATLPPPAGDDTLLGAGDVFEVRVYDEDDLSGTYRVAQDGTIDFPLVGQVTVAGQEPPAVASMLASALRDGEYLRSPQVSVFVKEYNSKRVNVVGAVAHPGTFTFGIGMTVVQAISQAGGFTSIASRNSVVVSRQVDGALRRYRVPVEEVTEGRRDDLPLRSGDTVYVPERIF